MRIGVFGGTFDPVHLGHLITAEQAREQANLDQVWFVPSARPPHKLEQAITSFERRFDMLQLALAGQTHFRVDFIEKERPGPSYTADTLADLARAHPDHEWFLLVGADCLPDLVKWHQPQQIVERATLLVADRLGFEVWEAARLAESLDMPCDQVRLKPIRVPLIEISSRDLRQRAREGRSLLYFVPRAVEMYIREKRVFGSLNRT